MYGVAEEWLAELGFRTRREHIHPDVAAHPAHTLHPASDLSAGRSNLRAARAGATDEPGVLFNCHADVVPPSRAHGRSFEPELRGGAIYGRGTADTKGNLVMLLEALRFLDAEGIATPRPVSIDVVMEEEIGGNGTLSTILHGVEAAEVVVLEPTSLQVFRGHRGCLTFGVDVVGRPVHMGADQEGVSAVHAAMELIAELRSLEARMLEEARADPDFAVWRRPLQVNVGRVQGGEWPGSVPARCTVEGNMGFLARYSVPDAQRVFGECIAGFAERWSAVSHEVRYPGLRTEGYMLPADAPLVGALSAAVRQKGSHGWLVSCDARLYARLLGLPTVIFGAGRLTDAHGDDEHVAMDEIRDGALALAHFLTAPRPDARTSLAPALSSATKGAR